MSVGERIRERRKELKLSVDEVAKRLGKNRATVYRYEGDEIEDMSINLIAEIAKVLQTDPGYLMGWKKSKENLSSKNSYTYFPTSISAGTPLEVSGLTQYDIEEISLPDAVMGKWAGSKDIFFTKINGDSMNKVMTDGSLIAAKKVTIEELSNNDIVIFSDDYDFSVKRYFRFEDRIIFRPDSTDQSFTDHEVTIHEASNLTIHGKVVLYVVEND